MKYRKVVLKITVVTDAALSKIRNGQYIELRTRMDRLMLAEDVQSIEVVSDGAA